MAYEGSVTLISGIKQANNQNFPLVDAPAVRITDEKRLPDVLEELSEEVIISSEEPTEEHNKLWIKDQSGGTYSVPTYNELTSGLADKLDSPSTAGTSGQVLTSDGNGGQSWETPDPSAVIDDNAEAGDTDKAWSADKLVDEFAGKTDKVSSATNGNFAGLDSNGNLIDSGHKHSDYLTEHQDISGKANKTNPVFTGSVSMGRTSGSTVGTDSTALGTGVTANGNHSLVFGQYNKPDSYAYWEEWQPHVGYTMGTKVYSPTTEQGNTVYQGYQCREDHISGDTFNSLYWLSLNTVGIIACAEIVGNGTSNNNRSNARVLDWDGNERLKGWLYVMCNDDSSGGKIVATQELVNAKANKANPVFSGSISFGRLSGSTVGVQSIALGEDVTASGNRAFAEGMETVSSGTQSHSEGAGTTASGNSSHAEGMGSTASGWVSHAEGSGTTASGSYSHAEGIGTVANHKSQHVAGEYNVEDASSELATNRGNYAEIVGNGSSTNDKSNARVLDWNGNERLAGDLYVGCNDDSTGGTKVATLTDISGKLDAPSVAGTAGKVLGLDSNLDPVWTDVADPTVIEGAVEDWLDEHPEATTTVQDGSITNAKLHSTVQNQIAITDTTEYDFGTDVENAESIVVRGNADAFTTVHLANRKNYLPQWKSQSISSKGITVDFGGRFAKISGEATERGSIYTNPMRIDCNIPAGSYKLYVYRVGSYTTTGDVYFSLIGKKENETESTIRSLYLSTSSTSYVYNITLTDDIIQLLFKLEFPSDIVFTGTYNYWLGLYPSDVTVVDTETSVADGSTETFAISSANYPNHIDAMQHEGAVTHHPTIQHYVDNRQINIDEELTYTTPEAFGAKGNNDADDTTAINNCIAYAYANNIAVRGYKQYKITQPIVISG